MAHNDAVEAQITQSVADYCNHHEVEEDAVVVTRERDEDGRVVRFRLSLDADGRSRGCDEWHEAAV